MSPRGCAIVAHKVFGVDLRDAAIRWASEFTCGDENRNARPDLMNVPLRVFNINVHNAVENADGLLLKLSQF